MFLKITLVLIFLQIAVKQVLAAPDAAVEAQLINLREGQRLLSDELHELYEKIETNILKRIKDLLCTGCKANTTTTSTTTTTQTPNTKPRSCKEWLQDTGRSDIYLIKPSPTTNLLFEAYCYIKKDETETSFWTVILRRQDGSVDFNRNWQDYQRGFGKLDGEFILGLDYIHELTRSAQQELWVELELRNGTKGYAKYDNFRVGNSGERYVLKSVGRFSGNIYDAMTRMLGQKWSTKEVQNHNSRDNCAVRYGGGWWFDDCSYCVLTGYYNVRKGGAGIWWFIFPNEFFEIKYALMAIRQY